jgi:hypothetical protein
MEAEDAPLFMNLPKVPNKPQGCAWGLWDKNGEKDQLGTLNWLTPKKVLQASQEIKTGVSVSLK